MKYIEGPNTWGTPTVELTRRNLRALLDKLDDPISHRTLVDCDQKITVTAVEDAEHYSDRPPGEIYMPSTGKSR